MEGKVVYFMRHGDTGMSGRYIGSTDIGLSKIGIEQVRITGKKLQEVGIQRALCSPLIRCRHSFDLLGLDCACNFNEELREVDFGLWEGKSFDEIVAGDKSLVDSWVDAPASFCFPGGESLESFRQRLTQFSFKLESISENKVLIMAHGGVIRHLLCLVLRMDLDNYLLFDVQPGKYSTVRAYPEGGVLTGFNLGGGFCPK